MGKSCKLRVWALATAAIVAACLLAAPWQTARATSPGTAGAIAFSSDRDGSQQVYRMGPDGFGQTRLTDTAGPNSKPAWSADGNLISFESCPPNLACGTYLMNYDGSGEYRPTNGPSSLGRAPWFPSGKKIALEVRDSSGADIYVAVFDAFGNVSATTRITTSAVPDIQPAISPDGRKMAFSSQRDGDYDIYVIKARPEGRTNRPIRLTNNTVDDIEPDWSPNGDRISFASSLDIFTMKPAPQSRTNRPKNLTRSGTFEGQPVYSPDGKKIAFASFAAGNWDIWRMRPDGSNQVNLTRNPAFDVDPSWQPVP